jgi:hypothetical protein
MGAPLSAAQPPVGHIDRYATVDDRDEVGVRGDVEGVSGPWPVDAREQHIAVERLRPPLRFNDGQGQRPDPDRRGDGVRSDRIAQQLGLAGAAGRVVGGGMEQPVQVVRLHAVDVADDDVADPVRASASPTMAPTLPAPMIPPRSRVRFSCAAVPLVGRTRRGGQSSHVGSALWDGVDQAVIAQERNCPPCGRTSDLPRLDHF